MTSQTASNLLTRISATSFAYTALSDIAHRQTVTRNFASNALADIAKRDDHAVLCATCDAYTWNVCRTCDTCLSLRA